MQGVCEEIHSGDGIRRFLWSNGDSAFQMQRESLARLEELKWDVLSRSAHWPMGAWWRLEILTQVLAASLRECALVAKRVKFYCSTFPHTCVDTHLAKPSQAKA